MSEKEDELHLVNLGNKDKQNESGYNSTSPSLSSSSQSTPLLSRLLFDIPETVDGGLCRKDQPVCFIYLYVLVALLVAVIGVSSIVLGGVYLDDCNITVQLPRLMICYGLFVLFKLLEVILKNVLVLCKCLEGWKRHWCLKYLFVIWLVTDLCLVLVYILIFGLGIYWTAKATNDAKDTYNCSVAVKGSFSLIFGLIPVLAFLGLMLLCRYCYWPNRRRHDDWVAITGQDAHAEYIDSLSCWYLVCLHHHYHHSDGGGVDGDHGMGCCDHHGGGCDHGQCGGCDHGQCGGCDHGQCGGCDHGQCGGCDHGGCGGCDHGGCDCSGCDIGGCDLSGCDCGGCDLGGC